MPVKYLNILALSAIVFLACSFSPTPVAAVSIDSSGLHARHAHIGQAYAKRAPRRCKARAAGDPTTPPASTPSPANLLDTPAPTPTPAAPAPAPAPAAPSNTGGSKAGLAFAYWDSNRKEIYDKFINAFPRLSFMYNWSPGESIASAPFFVPMLSNLNNIGGWSNVRNNAMLYTHALGFNEPDRTDQASMYPGHAAQVWREYMEPLKDINPAITLVSPAVASSDSGAVWFADFNANCGGCRFDVIAAHWYGTDVELFKTYLTNLYTTYKKRLWVSEFACHNFGDNTSCSADQTRAFAAAARQFLDNSDIIYRWAPFGSVADMGGVGNDNRLYNPNTGDLTDLAYTYFA